MNRPLRRRRALGLALGAGLAAAGAESAASTTLGVRGDRFTLNGRPSFLLGISWYGGLGAVPEAARADLRDMARHGFNWFRLWATWSGGDHDVSAVDARGEPRAPYFDRLRGIVAEADRLGLVVDLTLTPGRGLNAPHLADEASHARAVTLLCESLHGHRNWYLDLANEHNIAASGRLQQPVGWETLARLRRAARAADPGRLVTASHVGRPSPADLVRLRREVGLDFLCPHLDREPAAPRRTAARVAEIREGLRLAGLEAPVHMQEPFRRDFSARWQPEEEDFRTDLRGAREGGAAGWCFHNGMDFRSGPGWNRSPARCFDLRERRLFDQLDPAERALLSSFSAASSAGAAKKEETSP